MQGARASLLGWVGPFSGWEDSRGEQRAGREWTVREAGRKGGLGSMWAPLPPGHQPAWGQPRVSFPGSLRPSESSQEPPL